MEAAEKISVGVIKEKTKRQNKRENRRVIHRRTD